MELLSAKDFLEKLKTDKLKPAFGLKGLVKKSDESTEVMFAGKPNFNHWVKLPGSLIESAIVLKNIPCKDNPCVFVKLHLKAPTDPETLALTELLAAYSCSDEKCHSRCHSADYHSGCDSHCHCMHHEEMGEESHCHTGEQDPWRYKKFAGAFNQGQYCPCCGNHCSGHAMNTGHFGHGGCHKEFGMNK